MEYRKFKATYLFTGKNLLNEEHVLITDAKGKVIDIVPQNEAGEGFEKFNGILSPGFINAHCHLELSHLKGMIPDKKGLVDFVFNIITGRHFNENEILSAINIAENAMQQCGIVAVGDICNNNLTLLQKEKRKLAYHNFIEISGWNPAVAFARFEKSKAILEEFLQKNLKASITPHAPYSVSEMLWGKITPLFENNVVSIHNQETQDEDDFFLKGTGSFVKMYDLMKIDNSFYHPKNLRSVQTYFKNFEKAGSIILVHNTFTKQEDINYIQENSSLKNLISFCICANANLYIENVLPSLEMFIKNECNIIVGTDSLASNYQLSILEELKTISTHFPAIETEMLLQWATINGAKALQLDNKLGSFEKNKMPGVVLIENISGKNLLRNSVARRII